MFINHITCSSRAMQFRIRNVCHFVHIIIIIICTTNILLFILKMCSPVQSCQCDVLKHKIY